MTGTKEAGYSCCVNLPWSQKKYIMHNNVRVNPLLEEKKKTTKRQTFIFHFYQKIWLAYPNHKEI